MLDRSECEDWGSHRFVHTHTRPRIALGFSLSAISASVAGAGSPQLVWKQLGDDGGHQVVDGRLQESAVCGMAPQCRRRQRL